MADHPCQRCGSETWTDVDYAGCSDCREPVEAAERDQETITVPLPDGRTVRVRCLYMTEERIIQGGDTFSMSFELPAGTAPITVAAILVATDTRVLHEAVAAAGERDVSPDYLSTVQLSWGGLTDSRPHDGLVHLVRGVSGRGTPGRLLCGIDQHAEGGPGFSVGGGVSGPDIRQEPCPGCVETARINYPDLPIAGLGAEVIAAAVGSVAIRDVGKR